MSPKREPRTFFIFLHPLRMTCTADRQTSIDLPACPRLQSDETLRNQGANQFIPPFVPSVQKPEQSPVVNSMDPKSTTLGVAYCFFGCCGVSRVPIALSFPYRNVQSRAHASKSGLGAALFYVN